MLLIRNYIHKIVEKNFPIDFINDTLSRSDKIKRNKRELFLGVHCKCHVYINLYVTYIFYSNFLNNYFKINLGNCNEVTRFF